MTARALDFDPPTGNYKIFYFNYYRVLQVVDMEKITLRNVLLKYADAYIKHVMCRYLLYALLIMSHNNCLHLNPYSSTSLAWSI